MTNFQMKQVLNTAVTELNRCYQLLGIGGSKILAQVEKYSAVVTPVLATGNGICMKKNSDNSGSCFFQCDECRRNKIYSELKVKAI